MNNNSSKSGLFLMELILSILFFSLAGTVCIQMFVRAHIISEDSVELNHAVAWCQNIAEGFYGCNGNQEALTSLFDNCYPVSSPEDSSTESQSFLLPLDDDFEPLSLSLAESSDPLTSADCAYYIVVSFSEKEDMTHCHIEAFQNSSAGPSSETGSDQLIYELNNSLFSGKEAYDGQ